MSARAFFSPVGSVLASLAHRYGLGPKLAEYKLRHHWEDIAGAAIAAHTRPDSIRFKRLYLLVQDSVWLQQLTFLKPELIERVNASAGRTVLTDIVLRVGDTSREASGEVRRSTFEGEPRTPNPEPPASVTEEAATYAEAVTDADLRSRLARVIARALSTPSTPPRPPVP